LARVTVLCAIGCAAAWGFLRWVFLRNLGEDYGQAYYLLKSYERFLVPAITLSALLALLLASGALFFVLLLASHKVAGPLFRLQRVADHLGRLTIVGHIHLRDGDWTKSIAASINQWTQQRRDYFRRMRAGAEALEEALRVAKVAAAGSDPERTASAVAAVGDAVALLRKELESVRRHG
jgi:hypothetical protein